MRISPTPISSPLRRSTLGRAARVALCVAAVVPLMRWAVIMHAVSPERPWRRVCPRCQTPIGPNPNLGALSPRARCAACQHRLGPPPWTVEVAATCSAAALALSGVTGFRLAAYAWWAALGIVLAFVDLAVQRLPARLSYAALAGYMFLLGIDAQLHQSWTGWLRAALGGATAGSVLAACAMAVPRLVRWGDVRFVLAIGAASAFVGWLGLYAVAFLSTLLASIVGVGLIVARRATLATHLPQGPFLYVGTLVAVVVLL
jgi:leader peptidase (prepilin peptidase) / N-methyltransferase